MEFLASALKMKASKLVRDDSGVAMVFSMLFTFFIFLTFIASVVLGDHIQRKIALQTAVDNIAYAGALAQADALSKMAAINRAIAWTYVMNNRRHTDYIMNRYGYDVLRAFWYDSNEAAFREKEHSPLSCWAHHSMSPYIQGNRGNHYGIASDADTERINLEQIAVQIPKFQNPTVPIPNGAKYDCFEGAWLTAENYEDRQYGIVGTTPGNQYAGVVIYPNNALNRIEHGRIYTSRGILDIVNLFNVISNEVNAGRGYWEQVGPISIGSANLAALNAAVRNIAANLETYINDAMLTAAEKNGHDGMAFHFLIGGKPYTGGGGMLANCFYVPNESICYDSGRTVYCDYQNGDGLNANTDNWRASDWWWTMKQLPDDGGFYRTIADSIYARPNLGNGWHGLTFTWTCVDGQHYQHNIYTANLEANCFPYTVSNRQGISVVAGCFPHVYDDTWNPPVFSPPRDPGPTPPAYNSANAPKPPSKLLTPRGNYVDYPYGADGGPMDYNHFVNRFKAYALLFGANVMTTWYTNYRALWNNYVTDITAYNNAHDKRVADYWAARNAYLNYVNVQFPATVENYNKTKRSEYATTGRGWPSWNTSNCDWNWSAAASPRFLNHRMFGKLGSIVVGGRYGGNGSFASSGLLARAFNPIESQPICAVAAARAAVRAPGSPAGAYISSWETDGEYRWNLFVDDWDAIMLPVNKAWKVRSNGQWNEVPDVGLDLYGYEESRAVDILRAVANGLGITIRGLDENAADDLLH